MKKGIQVLSFISLISVMGCAGIEPPSPDKLLTHPLGTAPVHMGMTKNEVREILGEPDSIQDKGKSSDKGLTERQEWVYYQRTTTLPINYGYLAKSMRLCFDGDNLTSFKEE